MDDEYVDVYDSVAHAVTHDGAALVIMSDGSTFQLLARGAEWVWVPAPPVPGTSAHARDG